MAGGTPEHLGGFRKCFLKSRLNKKNHAFLLFDFIVPQVGLQNPRSGIRDISCKTFDRFPSTSGILVPWRAFCGADEVYSPAPGSLPRRNATPSASSGKLFGGDLPGSLPGRGRGAPGRRGRCRAPLRGSGTPPDRSRGVPEPHRGSWGKKIRK